MSCRRQLLVLLVLVFSSCGGPSCWNPDRPSILQQSWRGAPSLLVVPGTHELELVLTLEQGGTTTVHGLSFLDEPDHWTLSPDWPTTPCGEAGEPDCHVLPYIGRRGPAEELVVPFTFSPDAPGLWVQRVLRITDERIQGASRDGHTRHEQPLYIGVVEACVRPLADVLLVPAAPLGEPLSLTVELESCSLATQLIDGVRLEDTDQAELTHSLELPRRLAPTQLLDHEAWGWDTGEGWPLDTADPARSSPLEQLQALEIELTRWGEDTVETELILELRGGARHHIPVLLLDCTPGEDADCGEESWVDHDGDGFSELEGDCEEGHPWIHPAALEETDGQDDDCDGLIDETWDTIDHDGDGLSEAEGDCWPGDPWRGPGAEERCNLQDDDCQGEEWGDGWDASVCPEPLRGDGLCAGSLGLPFWGLGFYGLRRRRTHPAR